MADETKMAMMMRSWAAMLTTDKSVDEVQRAGENRIPGGHKSSWTSLFTSSLVASSVGPLSLTLSPSILLLGITDNEEHLCLGVHGPEQRSLRAAAGELIILHCNTSTSWQKLDGGIARLFANRRKLHEGQRIKQSGTVPAIICS